MEFEDILKDVGDFGKYQKTLVILLIPAFIVIPMFAMDIIFLTSTPDHWCHVPEIALSNLSLEAQKSLIRSAEDATCRMYDVNYTQILASGNFSVDPDSPTKECPNGWDYDKTTYDATAVTRWDMVCGNAHYESLALSLIFLGDVIATPFFGYMSDRWGRKPTFLFLAALTSISEIASVLIPNFTIFLILRAINGSTMSTIYGVPYIILLELVSPKMRARMNGILTTSWTIGLCVLPLVAWSTRNWIFLSAFTSAVSMSLLLYWKALPESPSWLISQEKYEEATDVLSKIGKTNGKTLERNQLLNQIQRFGEKSKQEKLGSQSQTPLDFFKYSELRKRFFLISICWMGNSITYFGLQINVKNLGGSEFLNFFLVSVIEVPAHLATWQFMERIGRRWCSVIAFLISGTACMVPVFLTSEYDTVGVVASLLGKAGSSSAFMTLYQQSPELYPTVLRSVGMGMSSTLATLATLAVPYIVYLARYGKFIPFMTISIISFTGALCSSFLPETLNKKLPQSIADTENAVKRRKFFTCREERNSESVDPTASAIEISVPDLLTTARKGEATNKTQTHRF